MDCLFQNSNNVVVNRSEQLEVKCQEDNYRRLFVQDPYCSEISNLYLLLVDIHANRDTFRFDHETDAKVCAHYFNTFGHFVLVLARILTLSLSSLSSLCVFSPHAHLHLLTGKSHSQAVGSVPTQFETVAWPVFSGGQAKVGPKLARHVAGHV